MYLFRIVFVILLFNGCAPSNYLLQNYGADVSCEASYVEQYAEAYFGKFDTYYTIAAASRKEVFEFCGQNADACSRGHHIIVHYPDTHEYICQQILHEMGHVIAYSEGDMSADSSHMKYHDFYFPSSDGEPGYVSVACTAMRTESICGEQ